MEVSLLCDCEDCHSTLIQLGCVNILCDIPFKLLNDFSESISESSNCNFNSDCELYEKLNCSQIHVILITHLKGFRALNLLKNFYDLSSTHIVCTRPVYILSSIYYSRSNTENRDCKNDKSLVKGFGVGRLIANLRERRYRTEFSLLDFLNNDLLHLVSYNEPLKITLTVSSEYTNHAPIVKALDSERLNDFSLQIRIVATSSGYCLGSCNYLIKHENVGGRVVYISKSSTLNRYTKSFDYSIFDNLTAEDVVIVTNTEESNEKIKGSTDRINNGTINIDNNDKYGTSKRVSGKPGSNASTSTSLARGTTGFDGSVNSSNGTKLDLKKEPKRAVKQELFSQDTSDGTLEPKLEESDEQMLELEKLSAYCIKTVLKGHSVIVPVDFNYAYLIDIVESLNLAIKKIKKQVYVYCVGRGVEEMFDYLDKCCDWVSNRRSELTMHPEDPKSPFPDLEQMKANNQFFFSDTLSGLSSVYREPSILLLVVSSKRDFAAYLSNENNRFLILQSKYYLFQQSSGGSTSTPVNNVNGTRGTGTFNSKTSAANVSAGTNMSGTHATGRLHISKVKSNVTNTSGIPKDRCVHTVVNLETNMSNINVNAKLVVLSRKNNYVKLFLDETEVGYIEARLKPESFDSLTFTHLFSKGGLSTLGVGGGTTSESRNIGTGKVSSCGDGDCNIEFNKFKVDCTNMNDVVLTPLKKNAGAEKTQSDASMKDTRFKSAKKSKLVTQLNPEEQKPEIPEEVNDLLFFGTYNYDNLLNELSKHFKQKPQVTKSKHGITISHFNFKLFIGFDGKRTIIETMDDKYRKCVLQSLQEVLVII